MPKYYPVSNTAAIMNPLQRLLVILCIFLMGAGCGFVLGVMV